MIRRSIALVACAALALSCAGAPRTPAPAAPPAAAPAKPASPAAAAPPPGPDVAYWENRKDLVTAPAPPKPEILPLPKIERWKARNGLEIIVVPRRDLPVASVRVAVKAGGYDEARKNVGVAEFTASMLRKGTETRTADEISAAVDFVGAEIETDAGSENSSVGCTALSKDLPLCLDVVSDVLLRPTFPEEEMREIRDQMLGAVSQRYDNPGLLAQTHFENLVFGDDHPDGRVLTPEDVARIGRADLVTFWKTFYRPNNSILVLAGDVDPLRVRTEIDKRFGRWRAGRVPPRPAFELPERSGARFLLVDKDDLTQATMVFGHRGIRHADPAFYAVTMVNYVLGGSDFSSRLMGEVRAKRGLTYGISSSFGAPLYEGAFRVSAATRNESVWPAFMASVAELRKMKQEGPSEPELAKGRGFFAGSYPFRLQSAQGIASSILAAELHGLGVPYVREFAVRMGAVDVAAARAAAAAHLQPENLVVVIVGRGDIVGPQLQKNGLKFERINYRDPISFAERSRLRKGAAAPTSPEGAKARALLERGLEAQGGAVKLRAMKDMTVVKSGLRREGDVVADLFATTYYLRPDRYRIEQEIVLQTGKTRLALVITPEGAKGGPPGQPLRPLPPVNEQRLRAALFEDPNFILLNILDAKPPIALQIATPLQEGTRGYPGVTLRLPGGEWTSLYFDPRTRLLARIKSPGEGGIDKIEALEDYRDVAGLRFSFRQVSAGVSRSEATVKEIKIDSGLKPELFQ